MPRPVPHSAVNRVQEIAGARYESPCCLVRAWVTPIRLLMDWHPYAVTGGLDHAENFDYFFEGFCRFLVQPRSRIAGRVYAPRSTGTRSLDRRAFRPTSRHARSNSCN